MSRRISSPTFVSRAQELRQLDELLGLAKAGASASVLVAGEAGVGKTRLVQEFTTRAATSGARVLAGGCIAFAEGELAYGPLVEALRSLVRQQDPAAQRFLGGGVGGELAGLVPELGGGERPEPETLLPGAAPAEPTGGAGRLRLFQQLLGLLEQLGRSSPVVLVVEDLQWADRSTMEFLAFLLRNLDDQRLVLIGTYRSDELGPTHWLGGWIAEQRRSGQIDELQLQPFSRGELAEQLGGILGAPVDPGLVDSIYARCEGNAFFAEELAAAAAKGTAELPSGLREVLLARLRGLSGAARAALRVAAVAGRRVDHRLLAAADVMAEAELTAALREAVDNQLLVTHAHDPSYGFRHALVQEAVYGELLPGERTRLHGVFAPALTELLEGGAVDRATATAEVARHWELARDLPEALAWAVRAGAAAERVHAFAEALAHDQRALALWDRVSDAQPRAGVDRVELARRAAHAAHAVGDYQLAASLIEVALAQVDPAAEPIGAGLLQERRGLYLTARGDEEAAFAAYRQAVRLVPATPPVGGAGPGPGSLRAGPHARVAPRRGIRGLRGGPGDGPAGRRRTRSRGRPDRAGEHPDRAGEPRGGHPGIA
jgi:predicted ATPase